MSRLTRRKAKTEEDVEVNMVPIMNMFLVLIPFLLMSASFFHIKVIKTSAPVQGEVMLNDVKEKDKKVTVIAEIKKNRIQLSANSDSVLFEEIKKWEHQIKNGQQQSYRFDQLTLYLQEIKQSYPSSDTVIIVPDQDVEYDTIIQAMDAARYSQSSPALFPNVVLSGRVG
jgi:biopolymer transport protein ExbD